jgi:Secretion system C-terminal sorting domain/SprB repeat
MKKLYSLFVALFAAATSFSQCLPGQVEVTLVMHTDSWPYENYWQLNVAGTGCTDAPLYEGANTNVGCAGTAADNSANGYAANSVITVGPMCLDLGVDYEIVFVDSYGDGGLVIEEFENGALMHAFTGTDFGNTWTFTTGVTNIPSYDSPCAAEPITADGPSVSFNNTNAISALGEVTVPGGPCGVFGYWCEGAATNTVWASFTPTASNVSYEISTCNPGTDTDTQLAIYKVTDCYNFSTYELISSNDDQLGGCGNGAFYASTTYTSCLEAGQLYLIQVDGWSGAVGNIELTVRTYNSSLSWNAEISSITCPLDKGQTGDGAILPYSVGAGANFDCVWTGPDGFTSTSHFLTNLGPGDYTLVATTGCGETYSNSYQVTQPSPWIVTSEIINPSCENNNDGSILVMPSGATGPYTYGWIDQVGTPISNNNPLTGVGLGTYNLSIADANECIYPFSFTLTDCTVGVVEMSQVELGIYPNPSNGSFRVNHVALSNAQLEVLNEVGQTVHMQRIDNGSITTEVNARLAAGVYFVRAKSAKGSTAVQKMIVE